jgi:hypothetical protein
MAVASIASEVWEDERVANYLPEGGNDEDKLIAYHKDRTQPWDSLLDRLLEIRTLKDDWDGLGAAAPRPEIVDSAIRFLKFLRRGQVSPPPSRVAPSSNGAVLFEWQSGGSYKEAEIEETHRVEWMELSADGSTRHWSEPWEENSCEELTPSSMIEPYSAPTAPDLFLVGDSQERHAN